MSALLFTRHHLDSCLLFHTARILHGFIKGTDIEGISFTLKPVVAVAFRGGRCDGNKPNTGRAIWRHS
ncbi:hypothetical protein Tco_0059620 [Tanacetum coccineum]